MKFKKFALIFSSILIANHCYAGIHLDGGLLLNHLEEQNITLPEYLKNIPLATTTQASTSATANPASGYHGNNIRATGNVAFSIHNNSSNRQYYYVDIYMCIDHKSCMHIRDTISVDPYLNSQAKGSIFTTAYIPNPGKYEDEAIIVISGSENSTSKGINTVQVL